MAVWVPIKCHFVAGYPFRDAATVGEQFPFSILKFTIIRQGTLICSIHLTADVLPVWHFRTP